MSIFIVSTFTDGRPPEGVEWFCDWVWDASNDFRVQKALLKEMQFCVFGLGNSLYQDNFNKVGVVQQPLRTGSLCSIQFECTYTMPHDPFSFLIESKQHTVHTVWGVIWRI